MPTPTPGKIFLADQRGLVETRSYRRFSTFSFGAFQHVHKQPLGCLRALNEEILAGSSTLTLPVVEATHLVLLPITGAIAVRLPGAQELVVEVEEIQVLTLSAGSEVALRNPYPTDLVTLLHIWLRAEPIESMAVVPAGIFSLAALANQLLLLLPAKPALPFTISLGRFAGRHEATCVVPPGHFFFAFVLAGAFEVEGRLLHEKDGLALWDAAAPVELEALSTEALLLILTVAP
jgi:hypothetical protein